MVRAVEGDVHTEQLHDCVNDHTRASSGRVQAICRAQPAAFMGGEIVAPPLSLDRRWSTGLVKHV